MVESQGRGTGARCSVLSLLATRAAQSREAAAGQGAAAGTEAAAGRGATAGQRAEAVREAAAGAGRSDQKVLGGHSGRGKTPPEAEPQPPPNGPNKRTHPRRRGIGTLRW